MADDDGAPLVSNASQMATLTGCPENLATLPESTRFGATFSGKCFEEEQEALKETHWYQPGLSRYKEFLNLKHG